ncbi:MAG: A/G-specific adenine glycosylase [Chlorobi bacterium]|nr:A/G-specific adenine glycosylase [Chlorobiota bacterium]
MIPVLNRKLLRWYQRQGRDLPWRSTSDPYHILVSEIMLQQTQVERVKTKFPHWLQRYPTMHSLARSTPGAVLRAWQGMGYNRRALQLHACAVQLVERFQGDIPRDYSTLRSLPGIGPYTSNAILCFAFNIRVVVIDVNVTRVLSRIFHRQHTESDRLGAQQVAELGRACLPRRAYRNWTHALMDLGALVCTARSPRCRECPVRNECASCSILKPLPKTVASEPRTVPRRIHRGRIVELLRLRHRASFSDLGKHLKRDFTRADHEWLADILESLFRDNMIAVTNGRRVLSLPDSLSEIVTLDFTLPD